MSEESTISIAIGVITVFVGTVTFVLNRHFHVKQENRRQYISLVNLLRKSIPTLQDQIRKAYLDPLDLNSYTKILREYDKSVEYELLPKDTKRLIESTQQTLEAFMKKFGEIRVALYQYFEKMPNRVAGGGFREIVATNLICMEEGEIPRETVLVNFPRESIGSISQARLDVDQILDIRKMAREKLSVDKFLSLRESALDQLVQLSEALERLQRI